MCAGMLVTTRAVLEAGEMIGRVQNPNDFFAYYNTYTLWYTVFAGIGEFCILCEMFIGQLVGIFCNFGSLKLYGKLPITIYIYMPMLSVFIPFLVDQLLPLAARLFENSCDIVKNKFVSYSLTDRKLCLVRQLESLRPLAMFAGVGDYRFFKIEKSTRASYYSIYVDYTVNALLSINI